MIVLPLTEEARSGRRIPWVTLALAAACVAVFLHVRTGDVAVDERTEERIEEAWTFFAAHPYVKVDEDLTAMMGEGEVAAARDTFRLQMRRSGSPPIPDFVVNHDQVAFDRLVEEVYRAMESHSFYRLGFFPESLSAPDTTLLSYVLVHEDWLHLLTNLAILLLAGMFLEEVWGRVLFALFLATGAVAGATGYAWLDPEAGDALGGASGVAAALCGAFLVRFAATPIRFQYFFIPPLGGKFTARGWITLPIYGALYVAFSYLSAHGAPGIEPADTELATWAHVGGIAWGGLFALSMKLLRIEERFIHPKIEKKLTTRSNPTLERALEAREAGRLEEALELLASEVTKHPGNHDACLAYWDVAGVVGRPLEAADALGRVLRDEVSAGQHELAVQHWRELTQRAPGFQLEAALEVRVAGFLIDAGEYDLATFSMRRILDGQCGAVSATIAHRLARAAQDLDVDIALEAARRSLSASDLEPSDRDDVERLVRQLEGVGGNDSEPSAAAAGADSEFGAPHDFDGAAVPDPSARELEPAPEGPAPALAADEEGDVLNAPPFELDDTPPPDASAPEIEVEPVAGDSTGGYTGRAAAPAMGLTIPPPGLEHTSHATPKPMIEDEAIPLADETIPSHRPIRVDDAGAPDLGDTLDPSVLGATTLPAFDTPEVEPIPERRPPRPPAPPAAGAELASVDPPAGRRIKKMEAVPLALGEAALTLDVGERGKAQLGLERIDAVAVAGVRGLASKPVVVIDLITNWHDGDGQPLKVVRLRSDRFDPRRLVEDEPSGLKALKTWIARLLDRSGAVPLPDPRSAGGSPFRVFEGLAAYEREVLRGL